MGGIGSTKRLNNDPAESALASARAFFCLKLASTLVLGRSAAALTARSMGETATTDGALIAQLSGVKVEVMEGTMDRVEIIIRVANGLLRWWMGGCQ